MKDSIRFKAGDYEVLFPSPALIMGVINVTPDSFSDGGHFFSREKAVERGLEQVRQGAHILDIGGESTRPFAREVDFKEECRRVLPVIEALREKTRVPISIDTQKASVATEAVKAGASIINNIAAAQNSEEMLRLVGQSGVGYVAMHMKGTPQTMQLNPGYDDVMSVMDDFFEQQLILIRDFGIGLEQVILDVGIGFGKSLENNLQLLAGVQHFTKWKRPLLLGVSRKSFIGRLFGVETDVRAPASLSCACWAVQNGVQIIRTHDVAETRQAIRMTEEIGRNAILLGTAAE
jgi:dihydropteroate synthase